MESKMIFMNPNYVFRKNSKGKVMEGGMARNSAWETEINKTIGRTSEFRIGESGNRLIDFFKLLLTSKEKVLFFLYPSVGVSLFGDTIKNQIIKNVFLFLMKWTCKRNKVVFDISDLKYEQAISLEIKDFNLRTIKLIEQKIFHLNAFFVFASQEMRIYACNKYNLNYERTLTCINGGYKPDSNDVSKYVLFDSKKQYFVYAGTLNKGRNIKNMIDSFPNTEDKVLLLMGVNGEWIHEEYNNCSNILYIGALEERIAHTIVSYCDVGLIPYPNDRLYYDIAFPTKLSFYLVAGIPVLATPTKEMVRVINENIGWVEEVIKWGGLIDTLTNEDIVNKKKEIKGIRDKFTWENTLEAGIRLLR